MILRSTKGPSYWSECRTDDPVKTNGSDVRLGSQAALGGPTTAFRSALGSGPCEAKGGSQPRASAGHHKTKKRFSA